MSPIRKKPRRGVSSRQIQDAEEDEYNPTAQELAQQNEDDVSSHHSPSPQRSTSKPRQLINRRTSTSSNDNDEDLLLNDKDVNIQNTNGHSTTRGGPVADTGGADPTLDTITSFQHNEDDDQKRAPPESRYASYAEYKRATNKRLNPKKTVKAQGASHRKISDKDWYINPKDWKRRSPGHPDYNPSQLLIPQSAYKAMSPGQAQYWKFKSSCFDGILFFKVGKFYEIYNEDARIGHEIIGMSLMAGGEPHVGFPERSFQKFSDCFLQHGYKVLLLSLYLNR